MDESSLDLFVPPDSQHPIFFESSDERGVEGRTVVTNEYHLQQAETDGQQEVQDAIGIAVANQDEVVASYVRYQDEVQDPAGNGRNELTEENQTADTAVDEGKYYKIGSTCDLFAEWPQEHCLDTYTFSNSAQLLESDYSDLKNNPCLLLQTRDVVEKLSIRKHVSNKGYAAIKQYIASQGIESVFFPDEMLKTYITLNAYIALVLGFVPVPSTISKVFHTFFWKKFSATNLCNPSVLQCELTPAKATQPEISNSGRSKPTGKLLQIQSEKRQSQDSGRLFVSRAAAERVKEQKLEFKRIATDIHKGGKVDLINGIAAATTTRKQDTNNWDGTFSPDDIIELTKQARSKKGRSVYEEITSKHAATKYFLNATDILYIQDQFNLTNTFRLLRKKMPGYFDSERQCDRLRKQWHSEFIAILKPERIHNGWKIDINGLTESLRHLYYWLPSQEWWRIYGDARTFGGHKSTALSIAVMNNEAVANDVKYHTPQDYWATHIFYGDDSRENLKANLIDKNGINSLDDWISKMQKNGHSVYLSSDNVFANHICGGIDPKSHDRFSLYNYETRETKSQVGSTTGFRSELKRSIDREHAESLLPSLLTSHFIPCANHMMARITEHLVELRVLDCCKNGSKQHRDACLTHFTENINNRGVRNGRFDIKFETDNTLSPITLNVSHAETISAPPESIGADYKHILDNVASESLFDRKLPKHLQEALNLDSDQINEIDLEKVIWRVHWELYELARKDPDIGSLDMHGNPIDQEGLTENERAEYRRLADLFHALLLFRYGTRALYPYVMTRVDIVPILLEDLPFHGLMRGSTEGGERSHYFHQSLYFSKSSRGGGWKKPDPVLNIFQWMYRSIRERIALAPVDVQEKFEEFVKDRLEVQRDTETEHPGLSISDEEDDDNNMSVNEDSNDNDTNTDPQSKSPTSGCEIELRRGDCVDAAGKYATFLDYTPKRTGARIVERTQNSKPRRLPLQEIHPITNQPLRGKYVLFSGNLNEKGTENVHVLELSEIVVRNGGTVLKEPKANLPLISGYVITTQRELNRSHDKLNQAIVFAYRRKWSFVSKRLLLYLKTDKPESLSQDTVETYRLDLINLANLPMHSSAKASISSEREHLLENRQNVSAHHILKKNMHQYKQVKENKKGDTASKPKETNRYANFTKENFKFIRQEHLDWTFKQVNDEISRRWADLSEEDKNRYRSSSSFGDLEN